jgi:hypothetical protein
MVNVKGCPTQRRQGHRITIRTGITMTIGTIKITIGSHCCATMTPSHAGCLPPRKNMTDRETWTGP